MIELRSQDIDLGQLVDIEPPPIFSAPRAPRPRAPSDEAPRRNARFSRGAKVGDAAAPGEIPYRAAPSNASTVEQLAQRSQLFARVKSDQEFIGEVREKAQAYATSAAMKRIVREADYKDHFLCPLRDRILEELGPDRYPDFVRWKNAAIQRIDAEPASPPRAAKAPCVSVSTRGLRDPAHRYRQHVAKERKLTDFLTRANGEEIHEPPKQKERGVDDRRIEVQRRTRFYYGTTEEADRVGRSASPSTTFRNCRRVVIPRGRCETDAIAPAPDAASEPARGASLRSAAGGRSAWHATSFVSTSEVGDASASAGASRAGWIVSEATAERSCDRSSATQFAESGPASSGRVTSSTSLEAGNAFCIRGSNHVADRENIRVAVKRVSVRNGLRKAEIPLSRCGMNKIGILRMIGALSKVIRMGAI
jgi:hypothetical protein